MPRQDIEYTTDKAPDYTGIYACRVRFGDGYRRDLFLQWLDVGGWFTPEGTPVEHRAVLGWIGPLARKNPR